MSVALTRLQVGIEATPFTAVAATRIQYEKGGPPREIPKTEFIEQARNMFIEFYDSKQVSKHAELSLEAKALSFEDFIFWQELFVEGGISPTGVSPSFVWVADDAGKSELTKTATIEGGDEISAFKMVGALGQTLEISGKGGNDGAGLVTAKYDLIGASADDASFTAALSDRTQTYMRFMDTSLFIDTTAGGIGGTQILTTMLGFTIKVDNKQSLVFTDNSLLTASSRNRMTRHMELSIDLLFNATALAQFQQMQAEARRFVQLKNTRGTNIWQLNMVGDYEGFDWGDDGPTRRMTLIGKSIYDPTLAYGFELSTTADVAAL